MGTKVQRNHAAAVLESRLAPLAKVRELVALGYDETDADALVSGLQVGPNQIMYYEQLPEPDYEPDAR